MMFTNKSKVSTMSRGYTAFTLAEVLITLGIIGIVASLTIPNLIANAQKQEYVAGLKKAYSTTSEGFKLLMADEGVSEFGQTSLFDGNNFDNATRQNTIDATMKKYFKITASCKYDDSHCVVGAAGYKFLNYPRTLPTFGNTSYNFQTTDGMYFALYGPQADCISNVTTISAIKGNCGNLNVDINGLNKPNQYGRDFFAFVIAPNGSLYPLGAVEWAKYKDETSWESSLEYWRSNASSCDTTTSSVGNYCAARIMENGWVMDY